MRLEDLRPHSTVRGVHPDGLVTVVSVQWFGSAALELTYKTPAGTVANELLYRHDETRLEVVAAGRPWSFDGDGALFRLVSEAQRIRLAHLFDPLLAVHTSVVDPLPHQITGVYEAMLPRQPLRFLLADDPGAGKTIMAGLLIKELIARGDLERCLIVCPGSLAEQWQDELYRRFQLPFEILTNDKLEAARTRNWFLETDLVIARLDKLSRDEDVQQKLQAPDAGWDLVVCDEAHKLSATFFGSEVKYTKRYRLGQLLSGLTRHFLLMTATPHNGKEQDFQLFLALLDGDRFEGRFRDGVHAADVSDLMRRMVKERLLKFDGKPLFPERVAYTVPYRLSDEEAHLYTAVTDYVREEFNRAEALANAKRAGTVGFALTILQRRLASSPEAIYQSLRRRRERLESRLRELEVLQRGGQPSPAIAFTAPELDADDVEDLDDAPEQEVEDAEARILDQATAARSIVELKAELDTLKALESLALGVRRRSADTKWRELASLLGEIFTATGRDGRTGEPAIRDGAGAIPRPAASPHQKLVVFTEHRDTLRYLQERITTLLGRQTSVVVIHGSVGREERLAAQEAFRHDPQVQVLLATDAAGEGINLQRAHLMVNYDLPWNPNRLEQRFGRIHRIGQTEVCHLWNLVADETREGDVYRRLLEKLEQARQALGGQVFDVLGKLEFEGRPLRELLLDAIRYGEQPEVRARLDTAVDQALDQATLQDLLEERQLVHDAMDASRVQRVREEMERAEARRLQPHYIESFFREAFRQLGGSARQREPRRYLVSHVPALIRNRDRLIGTSEPVLPRYERIVFEKPLVAPPGQPLAAFVCPGHPLLDAVIDLILERHRDLLKRGAVLVDERDQGTTPRVLFSIEHALQDAGVTRAGDRRVVSKRVLYVELDNDGVTRHLHYAPYLDYRPLADDEPAVDAFLERPECAWIDRDLEQAAQAVRRRRRRPGASRGSPCGPARADRQDRGGREGPPHQGDLVLGPPCRAARARRGDRQDRCAPQLGRGAPAGGHLAAPAAEADRGAEARRADLAAAAGGARRPAGRPAGPGRQDDRKTGAERCAAGRHARGGRAGARRRDGDRARPRLRADRPRARQARLRYREPGSGHRQAAVHRGQGPQERRRHGHRHEERDPVLAEQAGRLHPRSRPVRQRRRRHPARALRPAAVPAGTGLRGGECQLRAQGPAGQRGGPAARRAAGSDRAPA